MQATLSLQTSLLVEKLILRDSPKNLRKRLNVENE